MLLDAHGGAVAAGGHGLRRAAAAGVMGLLLLPGRRGASSRRTGQQAWSSAELWRVRGYLTGLYGAAAPYRRPSPQHNPIV